LGNSATAIEEVTVQGAQPFCPEATGTVMLPILATGSLLLDTNAKIVDGTTGLPATIAAGTGIVVGANAQAGSIFSDGPITLDQGAHVGAITTASTVTSATGVVQGAITPINPVLPGIAISPVFPSPQAAVDLTPNTMQTLAPGSYASLEVHPNATVTLQTGTYYFGSLYFHFSANVPPRRRPAWIVTRKPTGLATEALAATAGSKGIWTPLRTRTASTWSRQGPTLRPTS